MIVDPIVEEIHQVRAQLMAECNNDLDQLMDRYKASEKKHQHRLVTLKEVEERAAQDEVIALRGEERSNGASNLS